MSTSLLDRVPVEEIRREATTIRPGRALATMATGLLYGVGWLVGGAVRGLVFAAAAVRLGYQDGRRRGPA
jgi:hypothetical protein